MYITGTDGHSTLLHGVCVCVCVCMCVCVCVCVCMCVCVCVCTHYGYSLLSSGTPAARVTRAVQRNPDESPARRVPAVPTCDGWLWRSVGPLSAVQHSYRRPLSLLGVGLVYVLRDVCPAQLAPLIGGNATPSGPLTRRFIFH